MGDGREALTRLAGTRFDLVVLDLMLPGVDGLTICKTLRRSGPNTDTPVLMLTARGEESDTVLGLESGADDYLAKPFGVREFVARVRALLRRPRAGAAVAAADGGERPLAVHGVEIDPARRRVRVRGREVELTAQEFRLLLSAGVASGHRLQPRGAAGAGVARPDLRHAAQRRHAGEAAAQTHRSGHRGAGPGPHRVGRRLQVRRCLTLPPPAAPLVSQPVLAHRRRLHRLPRGDAAGAGRALPVAVDAARRRAAAAAARPT